MTWTIENIPRQRDRVAIVTGANSGIGYETARALAHKGATVVMACRNPGKGQEALDRIVGEKPDGPVELMPLDLSSLDSVRAFATAFEERFERLDMLINNAGVMVPPYGITAEGFETQFGTNHLGHFALTGLLLPLLEVTDDARVVNVSSMAHKAGRIDFEDLNSEQGYRPWRAYGQSKLANLLFTVELNRRSKGDSVLATTAHPGWTATNLQASSFMGRVGNGLFAMRPPDGALPTLRAATDPEVEAGDYYGPGGLLEMRGPPVKVVPSNAARDEAVARKLWNVSEALTGVSYLPASA